MDLVRAVIVGVPGTPYQDGLFFFDFLLPYDYPQVPPVSHSTNFFYLKKDDWVLLMARPLYSLHCHAVFALPLF